MMPTDMPEMWGQVIAQLGVGGVALWMLWKFGNKFVGQSETLITAAMDARDKDVEKAREERMETSDRLTTVLSTQRAELMAAISQQREDFNTMLKERDLRNREIANECHVAQERGNVAVARLADATMELRTGFASLEQAVRSSA